MNCQPGHSEGRFRRREGVYLLVILLCALAIRLWALSLYRFVGADGGVDGVAMVTAGRNLFSGLGLSYQGRPLISHNPLFPVLAGLAWRLLGDPELAGQLVSVLAGALAVVPVYFLARVLFEEKVARLTALMTAVFPAFIYTSTEIRVASLYMALLTVVALFIYRSSVSPSPGRGFCTGVAVGLAYLARPEAVIFLPFGMIVPLLKKRMKWCRIKSVLLAWVGMGAGFAVTSFPYLIFLRRHLHRWSLGARAPFTFLPYFAGDWEKSNFYAYAYPELLREEWLNQGGLFGFVGKHAAAMIRTFGENLLSLLRPGRSPQFEKIGIPPGIIDTGALLAVVILGGVLVHRLVTRRWSFRDSFMVLFCCTALVYLFFTAHDLRYFYPYLPVGLIVLAAGCVAWARRVAEGGKLSCSGRRMVGWGPSVVLVLFMLAGSLIVIPRKIDSVPYEYKLLGVWMKEHLPRVEESRVMSRKMGVPFYAGAEHFLIYPGSYEEVLEYARETGARYLVIDEWTIPWARPELVFLLGGGSAPPGLERIHEVHYRGRKAVLYEFR